MSLLVDLVLGLRERPAGGWFGVVGKSMLAVCHQPPERGSVYSLTPAERALSQHQLLFSPHPGRTCTESTPAPLPAM
jgi:hypothetical protein